MKLKVPLHRRSLLSLRFAVLAMVAIHCAGQVAPSGGPPDKTPPSIVSSFPLPGALNFHGNKIHLEFSKYVDRRTLEESVFFSPSLGTINYDWGGKDVELQFEDSLLRANTTYIMTIGTDLIDTRKNRMAKAFSLPFSTGEHIDSASISGIVIDQHPEGVMIFAYELSDHRGDTLNPTIVRPDYLTQTGADGSFTLGYLATATYRLIAVRDEFKNLVYDVQTDGYGTWKNDIALTPEHHTVAGLQYLMTKEDTTAPFLSSARSLDGIHVLLRFSKSIDPSSAIVESVTVRDTLNNTFLDVKDFSLVSPGWLEGQLVTAPQESLAGYRVSVRGLRDGRGNAMRPSGGIADFSGKSSADTSKPRLEFRNLFEGQKNVGVGDTIHLAFSEPILRRPVESGCRLEDSSKHAVAATFLWRTSMAVDILPARPLQNGMVYSLTVPLDSIVDYSGNRYHDSTIVRHFETIDAKSLSSLAGSVFDPDSNGRGPVHLIATDVTDKEVSPREVVLPGPGKFFLDGMVEGSYALWAFRDADTNGVYSYGKTFPFQGAERFTIYPDTLRLRARWPMEGIVVKFK